MKRLFTGVAALVVAVFLLSSTAFAATGSPYATSSTGVDVGYFNCSATLPTAAFGVVEVTDGLLYSTNSCAS